MSRLFGRAYKLVLDALEIEGGVTANGAKFGVDVAFKVEKSTEAEPNKALIQVYNLNPDHRGDFEKRFGSEISKANREPIRVELQAGYGDDIGVIFAADLRNLVNKYDGRDWITEVEGADAGNAFKTGRVSRSFTADTNGFVVAKACAEGMGVGLGNLTDFASSLKVGALGVGFPEGTVISGVAWKELDYLLRASGLDWSVQNGVLQVKRRGQPLETKVFELSPETGLLGSPFAEVDATVIPGKNGAKPSEDAAKRAGLVNVKTLLLHQLFPGMKTKLKSERFEGGYQIKQLAFVGTTIGDDWHCDLKVRPY
jgi:hypothetical protein